MKGRRYLQLVLLGILLYSIFQLWIANPGWYNNTVIIVIEMIILGVYAVVSAVVHLTFIIHACSDGYAYTIDRIFRNYSRVINLRYAYILLPEIMLYEKLARFLDKHLTSHDKR